MFTTSVQYLYELGLGNSLAMHFGNLTCDSKHLVFTLFLTEVNSSFHNMIILFRPPSDPRQTPIRPQVYPRNLSHELLLLYRPHSHKVPLISRRMSLMNYIYLVFFMATKNWCINGIKPNL